MTNFKASAKDLFHRYWWIYVVFAVLLAITHPPLNQILRLIAFMVVFTIASIFDGKWNLDEQASKPSEPALVAEE